MSNHLPSAPPGVVAADGVPAFGSYQGSVDAIRWSGLAGGFAHGRLWRALHWKRWQWVGVANQDLFAALALFRSGYVASCFGYVFSRREGRMLVERSTLAVPGLELEVGQQPGAGLHARFHRRGVRAEISRAAGSSSYRVCVAWGGLAIDLELDAARAAPALTAICPVPGAVANATQKAGPLSVRGRIVVDGRLFPFGGATEGVGTLDHTSGLLARETRWRWASMWGRVPGGPLVGLNLVTGFNQPADGTGENALWIGDQLIPLGPADIAFSNGGGEWTVKTSDGLVDLVLTPEGARRETVDLKLVKSVYVQPLGRFYGTVRTPGGQRIAIDGLPGVTEDHLARW